jgi:hypothetical protein
MIMDNLPHLVDVGNTLYGQLVFAILMAVEYPRAEPLLRRRAVVPAGASVGERIF